MVINLATQQAVEGRAPKIITPHIELTKDQIIHEGVRFNAPTGNEHSAARILQKKAFIADVAMHAND